MPVGDDPLEVRARRTMRAAAKYFQAHKDIVIIALTELPHDDPEMIDLKVNKATRHRGPVPGASGGAR